MPNNQQLMMMMIESNVKKKVREKKNDDDDILKLVIHNWQMKIHFVTCHKEKKMKFRFFFEKL